MKAAELIWLYEAGERNFRGANLRGQSFRGRNLTNADFSRADLRGTDFSRAVLRNADFSGAMMGLERHYTIVLGITLFLVAAILGSMAGLVDTVAELEFHTSSMVELIPKWLTLAVVLGFAVVALNQGLVASFSVFILAFVLSAVVAAISSAAVIAAGAIAIAITLSSFIAVSTTVLVIIFTTAILALGPLMVAASAVAFGLPFLVIAVPSAGESAIGIVVTVVVLSGMISWQALHGNRKQALVITIASAIVNRWGTCFREADLTRANLMNTNLDNTDFSDAILTGVVWDNRGRPSATLPSLMASKDYPSSSEKQL